MVRIQKNLLDWLTMVTELVSGKTLGILLVHKHLKYDLNKTQTMKYKQRLNLKAELNHLIFLPLLILLLS